MLHIRQSSSCKLKQTQLVLPTAPVPCVAAYLPTTSGATLLPLPMMPTSALDLHLTTANARTRATSTLTTLVTDPNQSLTATCCGAQAVALQPSAPLHTPAHA